MAHMEYCSNGVDSRDSAYIHISAITMMIVPSMHPTKNLQL